MTTCAHPVLQLKLDQAQIVIDEALDAYPMDASVIAWSGGKDSTLLLSLVRSTCHARKLPLPRVVDIDQGDAFEEIIAFRARLVMSWGLDLVIVRNSDVLDRVHAIGDRVDVGKLNATNRQALKDIDFKEDYFPWIPSSPVCNYLMKNVPIVEYLQTNHVQAMFTGIRWDEHESRRSETYFSARATPPHTRIHPLLHFTERDIWDATFARDVPYNDLYEKGYRSIDTRSGTKKVSDLPAWRQDLDITHERSGRDPEKEKMMAQLRAWGYM